MADPKRHFKLAFGKRGLLIALSFLVFAALAIREPQRIKILCFSFLVLVFLIHLMFRLYSDPRFSMIVDDFFAYFTLYTERVALPKKIRRYIIHLMGNVKGKVILEFGASVGTLTLHLAEEVGKDGRIYATDYSRQELKIMRRRLAKRGHKQVTVLHDEQHHSRVHPDVPDIHTVVSIGMLGYMKDINRVLKDMNKRLKIGGKICFVDYDRFFDIIPNVKWLSDDKKIMKVFGEAGFNVAVIRKEGFAWSYIFIYGAKARSVSNLR